MTRGRPRFRTYATPHQLAQLHAVHEATGILAAARQQYDAALEAAREAGVPYRELARATGESHQAISRRLRRIT